MPTLLHLDSSPLETSINRELAHEFVTPGNPFAAMNFADPYVKAVLNFLGITDARTVAVGGVAQLASGAIDRSTLLQPALEQIRSAAA